MAKEAEGPPFLAAGIPLEILRRPGKTQFKFIIAIPSSGEINKGANKSGIIEWTQECLKDAMDLGDVRNLELAGIVRYVDFEDEQQMEELATLVEENAGINRYRSPSSEDPNSN